jgi:hypothetical protein
MNRLKTYEFLTATYQLKVWMLLRCMVILLGVSTVFFVCLLPLRAHVNQYIVQPLFVLLLVAIFFLLERFITETIEVAVSNDGLVFPKSMTKLGFVTSKLESFAWSEIAGLFFTDAQLGDSSFSPSGFTVLLKNGDYRSMPIAASSDFPAFKAHIINLTQTLDRFKNIDMQAVGRVAGQKQAASFIAGMCFGICFLYVLAMLFDSRPDPGAAGFISFLGIPGVMSYLFKLYFDKKLRKLVDLD